MPQSIPTPSARLSGTYSGRRVALSVASWSLAGIAVGASFLFTGAGVQAIFEGSGSGRLAPIVALLPIVAWVCLAVMNVGWLRQRRIHPTWVLLGTAAGFTSAIAFYAFFYLFIGAVPLAVGLAWYHLRPSPSQPRHVA